MIKREETSGIADGRKDSCFCRKLKRNGILKQLTIKQKNIRIIVRKRIKTEMKKLYYEENRNRQLCEICASK